MGSYRGFRLRSTKEDETPRLHIVESTPEPGADPEATPAARTSNRDLCERLLRDSSHLFESGQFAEAEPLYQQALVADPTHRQARLQLAICLEKLNRWEAAADQFRTSLSVDPDRFEAQAGLGICLLHLHQHAEALGLFEKILAFAPQDSIALVGKAAALQRTGQLEESGEILCSLLLRRSEGQEPEPSGAPGPGSPNQTVDGLLRGLVSASLVRNDFERAIRYGTDLLAIEPGAFDVCFNIGFAHHQLGDLANAEVRYDQAISNSPSSYQPYLNLAMIRHQHGDLQSARKLLGRALEISSGVEPVLWNLALVLEELGELFQAELCYDRLVAINPDWDDAWFRLGCARLKRGEVATARAAFDICLDHRPDWPEASFNAGLAYLQLGFPDMAQDAFASVYAQTPESYEVILGLLAASVESGELSALLKLEEKLEILGNPPPEILFNLGLRLEQAGRVQEAECFYERAALDEPVLAQALVNLGNLKQARGERAQAAELWLRALASAPELAAGYFE